MADYWKSTPKYWCKHCQVYVPDTKLQRTNHEATGKHQSAVRRALRNLHRDHERQEREKEEAKREVARLNALVDGKGAAPSGSSGGGSSTASSRPPRPPQQSTSQPSATTSSNAPREQLEQLAELGVSIPDAFRPDLAMAGDWTVTETRVVEVQDDGSGDVKKGAATRSFGVRKRPRGNPGDDDDDDDDVGNGADGGIRRDGGHSEFEKIDLDAAVQGLFKRPRQWGRDSRMAGASSSGGADDIGGDLDSLLSSAVAKPVPAKKETEEEEKEKKKEEEQKATIAEKVEPREDAIKKEDDMATDDGNTAASIPTAPTIKKEEVTDNTLLGEGLANAADETIPAAVPVIMFKKRKAKQGRKG
ncbi:MAG: hypothetical protein STHCBS139747_004280 [Sporothrix thermara]